MKIGNILQAFRIHSASKRKIKTEAAPPSPAGKDSVSISSQAQSLHQIQSEVKIAKEALKNTPDVRESRISDVSQKIQSGYYNSAEFKASLSERLSGVLARDISRSVMEESRLSSNDDSGISGLSNERLQQIRGRIDGNYYNDRKIKSEIAEKILKNIGY